MVQVFEALFWFFIVFDKDSLLNNSIKETNLPDKSSLGCDTSCFVIFVSKIPF